VRLTDLEPVFERYETRIDTWTRVKEGGGEEQVTGPRAYYVEVATLAEAQGIRFICPKCFNANGKQRPGVHSIVCWSRSRGVPDDAHPGPGRWMLDGTGFHDLTLNGDPPGSARSVLLKAGCGWHGFITNGEVTGDGAD
jgi:hypothetical protein